jgi:pimeloyl-ACP methyl ester carboxylesterase
MKSVPFRGIVVLIHGLGSTWWQWRNVINQMRDHPSFRGYAFYAPNVEKRANVNSFEAAREIADQIAHFHNLFAADEDRPMDLIMVDTSMGSRIGLIVETILSYSGTGIPLVNIRKFVHVCISAFIGPIPLGQWGKWSGLIRFVPMHESLLEAAHDQRPHDQVITTWRMLSVRRWNKDQAHYHFIASEHDELIPMSSSVPPSSDNRNAEITVTTVPGVCHAGVCQKMAPVYIQWIAGKIDEQDRE